MPGDNIYPDLSNDKFDIQYARLLGLSSDLQASLVTGETGTSPVIKTPDDNSTGFLRFGVAAEDALATQNRSFDLAAGFSFALTQLGNNHFLVDPPNGLYQLGAIPVPGSDSGLSYTYLEVNDTDGKILLQAPSGIIATGYGYGNHSGTAAFNLAVDAGGNLIEVAAGGGGSGTVNSGLFRKAAYYITDPSGTIVDDWAGVEFGNTNLNTKIITQATTEIGLEIKLQTSQTANALNISSASGTGDLMRITKDGFLYLPGADYPNKVIDFGGESYITTHSTGGIVQVNASGATGGAFASSGQGIFIYNDNSIVHIGTGNITNNYTLEVVGSFNVSTKSVFGSNVITTPTALVHIAAGTAAVGTAPIKLVSGTAMTITEDGAMEYHNSHLYFTIGSTRYQLDQQGGSDTNFAEDDLTATGNRTHVFGANTAEITFNSLAGASGFKLSSTSTAAASDVQTLLNINLSGVNSNSGQDTYAAYIINAHTGTGSNNYGLYVDASGGAGNTAIRAGSSTAFATGIAVIMTGEGCYGINAETADDDGIVLNLVESGSSAFGSVITGVSLNGFGIDITAAKYAGSFSTSTSGTNDVVDVVQVRRISTGTPAAGIGGAITFYTDDTSAFAPPQSNQIISKWTDATAATITSSMVFRGVLSAALVDLLILAGDGSVKLRPITATAASAITAADGMILYASDTDATFTAVGFWGREAGAWVKL